MLHRAESTGYRDIGGTRDIPRPTLGPYGTRIVCVLCFYLHWVPPGPGHFGALFSVPILFLRSVDMSLVIANVLFQHA